MSDINFCPNCGHDLTKYEQPKSTDDEIYLDALRIAAESGKVSTSLLQRSLRIGYGRAARILEDMTEQGYAMPADGSRPRDVNIKNIKAKLAEG